MARKVNKNRLLLFKLYINEIELCDLKILVNFNVTIEAIN